MLKADREGITPEQLIAQVGKEHLADFTEFGVEFDNYHSTHSEENRTFSSLIYKRLRDTGISAHARLPRLTIRLRLCFYLTVLSKVNVQNAVRLINTAMVVKCAVRLIHPPN